MDRISGTGYILNTYGDRVFQDANLAAGISGTIVNALFQTDVQEEICQGIEGLGATCAEGSAQLVRLLGQPPGGPVQAASNQTPGAGFAWTTSVQITAPAKGYILCRAWANVAGTPNGQTNLVLSAGIAGGAQTTLSSDGVFYSQFHEGTFPVNKGDTVVVQNSASAQAGSPPAGVNIDFRVSGQFIPSVT